MMGARTVLVELDHEVPKLDASSHIWNVYTVVDDIAALQYSC